MRQVSRNKVNWKSLAREFNNMVKDTTKETAVIVQDQKDWIEISPASTNTSNAFFCTEEIVDFCRCKGLSNYVSNRDGVCVAIIH